jgi:hypothetical protein
VKEKTDANPGNVPADGRRKPRNAGAAIAAARACAFKEWDREASWSEVVAFKVWCGSLTPGCWALEDAYHNWPKKDAGSTRAEVEAIAAAEGQRGGETPHGEAPEDA